MYRWVVAWRWLKGLPILWVSVVGVALGVASILVVDSIFNGVIGKLREIGRGSTSDITVQTFLPSRAEAGQALPTDAMTATLLGLDGVVGAAQRLVRPCLLPPGRKLPVVIAIGSISRRSMVNVVGIDPAAESGVSALRAFLADVESPRRVPDPARPFDLAGLAPPGDTAIPLLVGENFAEELGLERGSTIELMTIPDVDPADADERGIVPQSGLFRVAGTFKTGSVVEDLTRAYAPRAALQRFAATLCSATEIAVKAVDGADLDALAATIEARLEPFGLRAAFESPVRTWSQQSAEILDAIDEQRRVLDLCLFCIVVVAGFNLLVSLHLLVNEKLRDVGTLAALGGSSIGIASIFTALGVLVTAIGALVGVVAGVALTRNVNEVHDALAGWTGRRLWDADVYFFDRIPVDLAPQLVGMAILGTFGVTLLFAFLGSLRVARLDPVETLRHEG